MNRSKFHSLSLTLRSSPTSAIAKRRPTSLIVALQWCEGMTTRSCHHPCHISLSLIPPLSWVPGLAWTQYRRPPGGRGSLGSGCSLSYHPSPPPCPHDPTYGRSRPRHFALLVSVWGGGVGWGGLVLVLSFSHHLMRTSLSFPSLWARAVPLPSLPCPLLLFECSLRFLMPFLSFPVRNISTLPQKLAGHTDAISLATLALRGLARQRGPAFATGLNSWTFQSCWCHVVISRRCSLLLNPFLPLNLDQSARRSVLSTFLFDSLYCYTGCHWCHG